LFSDQHPGLQKDLGKLFKALVTLLHEAILKAELSVGEMHFLCELSLKKSLNNKSAAAVRTGTTRRTSTSSRGCGSVKDHETVILNAS
jgi:hypothetical protein